MNAWSSRTWRLVTIAVIMLTTLAPTPIQAGETMTLGAEPAQGTAISVTETELLGKASVAAPIYPSSAASDSASPVALAATAAFTRSLALDGSGDYVRVPHDDALNAYTTYLTIEAWVRRASSNRCETIIGKNRDTDFWLGFCNRTLRLTIASVHYEGNTPVPANVWTHVAVVWTNTAYLHRAAFYINGQPDGAVTTTTTPSKGADPIRIGADAGVTPLYFWGDIAGVRLWSTGRTSSRISRLMHVALEEPLSGLMANWRLAEDYGDNVGGHDGTPYGGAGLDGPQAPPQPAVAPIDENFNTLPAARTGSSAVYVPDRNRVLLIGGAYASNVYAMNAGTGAAEAMTSMPGALAYASAAYVPTNDTAYVFGGRASVSSYSQSIRAIDPDTGYARTLAATFSSNLSQSAAVYHAGLNKVYVIGGGTYNPIGGVYDARRSVIVFNPISETLTTSASSLWLPQDRYSLAAAYSSATDRIYVFGGRDDAGTATNTIYEMAVGSDGLSGAVTTMTVNLPQPTYGLSAVEDPLTHLIYLLGGSNVERVLIFDPVTSQLWETQIEIEQRTYASAIFSPRNRHALLMGGTSAAGATQNNVWRIPLGDGPAVHLGRWDFPALSASGNVTAIDGDEDRVLIGTDADGVWRYDEDGNGIHYTPAALGSASGYVNDVEYYPYHDWAWITTQDSGARLFDSSGTSLIPTRTYTSSVLGNNNVFAIDLKPGPPEIDGSAFFGTWTQGLKWQYDSGSGWTWKTNFAGTIVTALAHRDPQDLWGISNGYLRHLTYYQTSGTAYEQNFNSVTLCNVDALNDLVFDPGENWWIAAARSEFYYGGVCFIPAATSPGTGTIWTAQDPVGDEARDIDVDNDGRVWVAFDDRDYSARRNGESGGLVAWEVASPANRIRKEEYNWENAPVGGNISDTLTITPVWESGITAVGAVDEKVWAGTTYQNLVTLSQRWQYLDESNSLSSKAIRNLWTVRSRLFLASSAGLHVLMPDGKSWDNRAGVQAYAVLGDRQGRTWVGTNNGLRRYTSTGWDMLTTTAGTAPTGTIKSLAEDANGRLWIGGANGVTLFDRERFVATFNASNSELPSSDVNALLVDNSNRLWIGTSAGLARLDNDNTRLAIYTTTHGLRGNSIYDLAQRGNGTIAVSTDGGLGIYDEAGDDFWTPTPPVSSVNAPLSVDELGRLWASSAVMGVGNQWQAYYWTNSGLGYSTVSDNAADGADRVWFSHYPYGGVSVRGAFLPPLGETVPIINSVVPNSGHAGDNIRINGSGFGTNPADVSVTIGGASAEVSVMDDDYIVVRLNDDNVSGEVSVSVNGVRTSRSTIGGSPAFCAIPQVGELSPTGGNVGVTVHLRGSNFDPDSQVFIGGAVTPQSVVVHRGPTHIEMIIQPADGNGNLRVQNRCSNSDTSDAEFRHIHLGVANLTLNQGVESYGLVPNQATMLQHSLSQDGNLRTTDVLAINSIAVTFTVGGHSTAYDLPYLGAVPAWINYSEARRQDIVNTVNAFVVPEIVMPEPEVGPVQVQTVLKNRGLVVAQHTQNFDFRPELPITVLLVPIMRQNYSMGDLNGLMGRVGPGWDEIERRMPLTGRIHLVWSPMIPTLSESVDIGSVWDLYVNSHLLDEARRLYNENHDPDALIAFGIVDGAIADTSSATGQAFKADIGELLNIILGALDSGCHATSFITRILTFGMLGFEEYCQLEIPSYVGWATGDAGADRMAALITHELGHIQGLVRVGAANYYRGIDDTDPDDDNAWHSIYDEMDAVNCNAAGAAAYNDLKTFYGSPGVLGPVVNPLTQQQLYPRLDISTTMFFGGTPVTSPALTPRGKAMMSYACEANNYNTFYEPIDAPTIFTSFGLTSMLGFFSGLAGGPLPLQAAGPEIRASSVAVPTTITGQRIYATGMITRSNDSGRFVAVKVLGENTPVNASFDTGYWLVQLSASGIELGRTGVSPVFSTVTNNGKTSNNDAGFFAATLLRKDGVARIELRHDNRVLDTWAAGSAAPSVSITSPSGSVYNSGVISVTWTATDANGDDLEVLIDYSADGGATWTTMATSGLDSGTVQVPVFRLGGSSNARFRVTASDGLNRGSAISAAFSVAAQSPRPTIGHPTSGGSFMEGRQVLLTGRAFDNQDGEVANGNLNWSSNRDGDLGTGSWLDVYLSAGPHTVTLQATNSVGLTATAIVTLTVTGDYDYDGISDALELGNGLNPLSGYDAYADWDHDGLPLITELNFGTNPFNPDTDGDGRNDADELVAGTNPTTADNPLPPDVLSARPKGLNFTADLSHDVPLPQQQVQVTSRAPVTWTLAANVNWLAASAISGTTPAGTTILVRAFDLENGTHHGVLTFTSAALGSVVTVPVTATVVNAIGHFDANNDSCVNVGDVQGVAGRIPGYLDEPSFSYRHDVDRDGDIDQADAQSIAQRWPSGRGACSASYSMTTTVVRVSAPATATVGTNIVVSILVDNPQNLGGSEFDLHFNPAVLQVQSVALGSLLSSTGRTAAALGPVINNAAGTVAFGGYTSGAQAGVSTSGELARITFHVNGVDPFALNVQNPLLADPDGNLVRASGQSGSTVYLPVVLRSGP